jgi:hypothetical protein
MQRAYEASDRAISEIAIVDTFTKLIFGQEEAYSDLEQVIIEAFRAADINVALDSHHDMGQYLRALGVQEMIQLVSQVREELMTGHRNAPGVDRGTVGTPGQLAAGRRAH